jgi:hypothetical protein
VIVFTVCGKVLFDSLLKKSRETPELITVKEKKLLGGFNKSSLGLKTKNEVQSSIQQGGVLDSSGTIVRDFIDKADAKKYVTFKVGQRHY